MSVHDDKVDEAISILGEEMPKLTKWKEEPTVEDLKQDYLDAKSDHDTHVTEVTEWLDNLYVQGSVKAKLNELPDNRSKTQPKVIRKNNEWRYSALSEPFLSTDDIFNTAPATAEDVDAAIQNGLILNHQFNNQIDKQAFIDELVRVFVDEGTAIIQGGWETEVHETTETQVEYQLVPSTDPQQLQFVKQAQALFETDIGAYEYLDDGLIECHKHWVETGELTEAVEVGEKEVPIKRVIKDQPTVEVCNYNNTIVDPSAKGDMSKARFVIKKFTTSYAELKASGDYENLDLVKIVENSPEGEADFSNGSGRTAVEETSSFNFSDKPRKQVVAYEYWGYRDVDGSGKLKGIVATWIGDVMVQLKENPFASQRLPFINIPYMPIKDSNYGEPDGELLKDNQAIIGAVTRGMVDVMARGANGQKGVRKGALDTTNKRKFDRGEDYEFNGNTDARNLVHMHTFDELPASSQVMLQLQHTDAESLTGVKAFASSGITGNALGDSVGGAKSAMDAAAKREMGILRRLSSGMIKLGRLISEMNADFLTEAQVVRITNNKFVKIRKDDLAGKFDIKLSISTPEADDAKAQEIAFMLQTLGNNVDFGITKALLVENARLRKMPDLAKRIEEYEPQPDPLAVKKAELEIQLLEAQLQNELAGAGHTQIKQQLDVAKTQKTIAETDKIELDTVEQEAGVTQERAKEVIREQSKGNIDMKVVENYINNSNNSDESKPTDKK